MLILQGKKYNIEAKAGASVGKIGIAFLSIVTALALCACGADSRQAQGPGTDSAVAAVTNADSFEYALPKQVAETIDAFDSPSISIQTLQGTLTMADDGKTKLEAEEVDEDSSDKDIGLKEKRTSKDSKALNDSKKKQGTKSKVGSAKSKAGVSSTKAITTGDALSSTPKADGALADDPLPDDPLTADMNPTVNNTNESPDAKSDVPYSKDDDPQIQQSDPEISANYYTPSEPEPLPEPVYTVDPGESDPGTNSEDPTPSSDIIAVFE